MPVSLPSPVPHVEVVVDLGAGPVDLATHALTAAVLPAPRFGRESELRAAARAAVAAGAELVDVSLEPRLVGAVARGGDVPVATRVATGEDAAAAEAAGAAVILVPAGLAGLGDLADRAAAGGSTVAVLADDLATLGAARAAASGHGLPLAIDTSRLPAAQALADEAVALGSGCRIVRTADVRRTRRVVEVVAALLEARREA